MPFPLWLTSCLPLSDTCCQHISCHTHSLTHSASTHSLQLHHLHHHTVTTHRQYHNMNQLTPIIWSYMAAVTGSITFQQLILVEEPQFALWTLGSVSQNSVLVCPVLNFSSFQVVRTGGPHKLVSTVWIRGKDVYRLHTMVVVRLWRLFSLVFHNIAPLSV